MHGRNTPAFDRPSLSQSPTTGISPDFPNWKVRKIVPVCVVSRYQVPDACRNTPAFDRPSLSQSPTTADISGFPELEGPEDCPRVRGVKIPVPEAGRNTPAFVSPSLFQSPTTAISPDFPELEGPVDYTSLRGVEIPGTGRQAGILLHSLVRRYSSHRQPLYLRIFPNWKVRLTTPVFVVSRYQVPGRIPEYTGVEPA